MDGENLKLVQKYMRKYRAQGFSETTINTIASALKNFVLWCGDRDIKNFTEDDVYDWLEYIDSYTYLKKGKTVKYSAFTKNKMRMQVKPFLAAVNPELGEIIKLKMPKNERLPKSILSKEEVSRLIDACRNNRDRAMIATFYESGARKSELLQATLRDISFDSNGAIVTIQRSKTGSRRVRLVFAASFLLQWIDVHPLKGDPEGLIFCSLQAPYRAISSAGIADQLHLIAKRAGIEESRVHLHAFRHSRATHLAKDLTEQQLKAYLGWTQNSGMAAVYVHLSGKDIDDAILKLNGIKIDDTPVNEMRVGRCPRCKELNPEGSLYCGKCGLPLKDGVQEKIDKVMSEMDMMILKAAVRDPSVIEALTEEFNKIQNNNKNS